LPVTPPDDSLVDGPLPADRSDDSAGHSSALSQHDHSAEDYSADSRPADCSAAPVDSVDSVQPPEGDSPLAYCSAGLADSAAQPVDGSHPAGCSANSHSPDDCPAGWPTDCSAGSAVPPPDGLLPADYSAD